MLAIDPNNREFAMSYAINIIADNDLALGKIGNHLAVELAFAEGAFIALGFPRPLIPDQDALAVQLAVPAVAVPADMLCRVKELIGRAAIRFGIDNPFAVPDRGISEFDRDQRNQYRQD